MQTTTHGITIDAPAGVVFEAIRDGAHWPYLNGLSVYAERISDGEDQHLMRISTVVAGELNSCTVNRTLDAASGSIYFQQTDVIDPLRTFGGEWSVTEADAGTIATVQHDFDVDAGPDTVAWLHQTIDDSSRRELEALKATSEWLHGLLRQHAVT
jgi:aromatase